MVFGRSTLVWMFRHDNNTEIWNELIEEIDNHKINITYISMCSYRLEENGTFGYQSSNEIPTGLIMEEWTIKIQSLGVSIMPLIDCAGSEAAEKLLKNDNLQQQFIDNAIQKAIAMNYSGYNLDWEVKLQDKYGSIYINDFIQKFALELHKNDMILSAAIAGYCPPYYMGTTCNQLLNSSFDQLYTMYTYQENPTKFRLYVEESVTNFKSKAATGLSTSQDPNNLNSQEQLSFVKENGINDIAVWVLTDPWGNNSTFWNDLGFFLL